jgi:hypothetical protein
VVLWPDDDASARLRAAVGVTLLRGG